VLGSLALALIAAFINIKAKQKSVQAEKEVFLRLKKNTGPVIRGFQYSNYHEGKKALNIRAAKFSIEKKKVGLFKLSPFKIACFRGAEIDLFGERHQHGNEKRSPRNKSANNVRTAAGGKDISFKGLLSQETLPTNALKGSVSAICEPVKINLYMDGVLVTSIQAEKAVVDPRRRRMILKKNIQAESGDTNLSANRLAIYPEKGVFEIENEYVLKKQDQTINGDKLTTDFLLEEVSTQ
jgi:hypothetical protein